MERKRPRRRIVLLNGGARKQIDTAAKHAYAAKGMTSRVHVNKAPPAPKVAVGGLQSLGAAATAGAAAANVNASPTAGADALLQVRC